ncbi:MAG: hypothetical protein IT371_03905 [Deltaproteobacteria bacterium]|nr:hypothetical protein [Deltaproteobacteria bacterium]
MSARSGGRGVGRRAWGTAVLSAVASLAACGRGPQGTVAVLAADAAPNNHRRDAALPRSQAATWPKLPRSAEATTALLQRHSRRPAPKADPLDLAGAVLASLTQGAPGRIAGDEPIRRWLQQRLDLATQAGRELYLLFGTYHDAGGQVEAFGRLTGPGGLSKLSAVVVEQLDADGQWAGLPAQEQQGDDELLASYLARGKPAAYAALAKKQARDNYTGWKYGYLPTVMDLVVRARAAGAPLLGCDMPRGVQHQVGAKASDLLRLRELHCLLALKTATARVKPPHRIAMIWGQDHVGPRGIPRLLPPTTEVLSVYVLGHRPAAPSAETDLGRRISLADPVLIPLRQRGSHLELALLLPDARWGMQVERARERLPIGTEFEPGLVVQSQQRGSVRLLGRREAVGRAPQRLEVPPGTHAYQLEAGGRLYLGALELTAGEQLELDFDPARRQVRVLHRSAEPARPSSAQAPPSR